MPNKAFSSKLFLTAILLTLVALLAKNVLPHKSLVLVPKAADTANYFLLDPEHPNAYWIDYPNFHFHCRFGANDTGRPCNFIYLLSPDNQHGMNLEKFNRLHLDIKYKGDAKKIRVSIRHFDTRFSKLADSNSTKFNFTNLRVADLAQPISLFTKELTVADWWLAEYDIPRGQAQPDLSNAITFSVDLEGDLRGTEHDFQINKIEFTGEWISSEDWYLAILLMWLFALAAFNVRRLLYLQKAEERNRTKISELVKSNSKLRNETDKFRKLSTVDALTNAFNRHGIEQIIESPDFSSTSTAIILLDVDHFKRINDRRGHDTGDRVLQQLSELILNTTRASDKFGRWGGEEFILICPNTTIGMAASLAEKLRTVIFDSVFEPESPIAVTASFGVTAIQPGETFLQAFKRADESLYNAKALGRNCVVVADEGTK